MINKPEFKKYFKIGINPENDTVIITSENESYILNGKVNIDVIKLIDGNNSSDDIVKKLEDKFPVSLIYYSLFNLESKGFIRESFKDKKIEETAFWDYFKIDINKFESNLKNFKVKITSISDSYKDEITPILSVSGMTCSDSYDLEIVITDDYLNTCLREINTDHIKTGKPWFLIKPNGIKPSIGPFFIPGKTACWECFAPRNRANRILDDQGIFRSSDNYHIMESSLSINSTRNLIYHLASFEISKWIASENKIELANKILSFDFSSIKTEKHIILQRPECSSCGSPGLKFWIEPKPMKLTNRKKTYTTDGGHRAANPEITLKKLYANISPISGIITELRKGADGDGPIHVYFASHNLALFDYNIAFKENKLRNLSAGKGQTDIQAKASAICEVLERYSGLFRGYELRKRASFIELGDSAIHPNKHMNYSKKQFDNRLELNKRDLLFHNIPLPFDETAKIEWTPIWSLSNNCWKYLPTANCYYGYKFKNPNHFFAWCDSNGGASGNSLEEAILHGFFELVERDAIAIWWYNMLRKSSVDLSSFSHPYINQLVEFYKKIGRDFWVLDLTTDLGIPVFASISGKMNRVPNEIIFGFGCHLDPEVALLRSICEMNQFASIALDQKNETYSYNNYIARNWWQTSTFVDQVYLLPDNCLPQKVISDYKSLSTDDLLEDINICLNILSKKNLEMLALDQTREEIGLNAVKVFVPGLRHMWERLNEGRLYDIPVEMGWSKIKKNEDELNPISMFI